MAIEIQGTRYVRIFKLTDVKTGAPLFVSVDHIVTIQLNGTGGAYITCTNNKQYEVAESVEDITNMSLWRLSR